MYCKRRRHRERESESAICHKIHSRIIRIFLNKNLCECSSLCLQCEEWTLPKKKDQEDKRKRKKKKEEKNKTRLRRRKRKNSVKQVIHLPFLHHLGQSVESQIMNLLVTIGICSLFFKLIFFSVSLSHFFSFLFFLLLLFTLSSLSPKNDPLPARYFVESAAIRS